jgi:tetratricopeptide (TPR) repeat protein
MSFWAAVAASFVLVSIVWGQETPREALEAGRTLYLAGDYAGAEGKFRAALETQPRDYIALCLLGATYLQEGKMEEAKKALDSCLGINPDYVPGMVNMGAWCLRSGDAAKAVETLESALGKSQGTSEGYFNLGNAYFALGQSQKALDNLSRAGELGMQTAELSYAKSLAKSALGDAPGALAEAKAACEQGKPGEAKYWAHLSRLESEGGDIPGAWEAAIKALGIDPHNNAVGVQLLRLAEEHPTDATAEQAQALQTSAEANPGSYYLDYAVGAVNLEKKDLDGAATFFQKAVSENTGKEQGQAWARLGLVFLLQEKWEAAIHPLEESLKADNSVVGVHSNLALALFHLAQWDRYEQELNEVLQLDPKNVGALTSLGSLLAYRSEWDKAETQFRLALAQKGNDADLLGKIGHCQLGQKNWPGAIDTLTQAVAIEAKNAQLFYLLGVAYEGTGDWEKALGAYRKVLEIDPSNEGAKGRIQVLGGGS